MTPTSARPSSAGRQANFPVRLVDGLRVVECGVESALECDWWNGSVAEVADVVRVRTPPVGRWPALLASGFTVKPTWVSWGAPLRATQEEFVGRLSPKEQRNIRDGERYVRTQGLRVYVEHPLTALSLEKFLDLYDTQVAVMAHGVPYARRLRQRMLDAADSFLLVAAHGNDGMAGGCVCALRPDQDVARIAFAAARPVARRAMLTRVLYMVAAEAARSAGFAWISLGSDPTLFGHVAKPGLFTFKSRLGFVPVPLQWLDRADEDAYDEAELVLSLSALTDPTLALSYAGPPQPTECAPAWAKPPPWQLDVLSAQETVDVRPFHAPFLRATALHRR
jgi:hypothetical protein